MNYLHMGKKSAVRLPALKMPKGGEMEHEETTSSSELWPTVEGSGHHAILKMFDPELFLSKRNAVTKMEQRLKERQTSPPYDPSHGHAINSDIITDPVMCLQTEASHVCPLRAYTSI